MKAKIPQGSSNPFETLAEAMAEFPSASAFRSALVDDVHFGYGRFSRLSPRELLDACGVKLGEMDEFCLSQVPSDRVAFKNGDSGWSFIYTYRIPGKNRRTVRFQSQHGDGGVCDSCVGPYLYRRNKLGSKEADMAKVHLAPTPVVSEEALIKELEALEDDEQRIERIGADLDSGELRYGDLDAWKLMELLGLDPQYTGEWEHSFWARKVDFSEEFSNWEHPYAKFIELLEDRIPAERYAELTQMAEEIEEELRTADLPLTKKEVRLLEEIYSDTQAPDCYDVTVVTTQLISSNGFALNFQVCIGDGGEPYDAASPYDLEFGGGFDFTDFIEVS